jgi:hypothetical protein
MGKVQTVENSKCDIPLSESYKTVWMFGLKHQDDRKNVTCNNQMIVAIVDVLTSFIFIFTNDNR